MQILMVCVTVFLFLFLGKYSSRSGRKRQGNASHYNLRTKLSKLVKGPATNTKIQINGSGSGGGRKGRGARAHFLRP